MKKFVLLTAVLFSAVLSLKAQAKNPPKNQDVVLFMNHVIQLHKASTGYLYVVYYENNLVLNQNSNPFNQSKNGFLKKEEALRIAKWQIIHFNQSDLRQMKAPQRIPVAVARQLKISNNL